jgi:hypothetical protein
MLARSAAKALLRAISIQNPERRPRCIITSFVSQSRDYGASGAAYDKYVIYWRLFDFCASGNLTLD